MHEADLKEFAASVSKDAEPSVLLNATIYFLSVDQQRPWLYSFYIMSLRSERELRSFAGFLWTCDTPHVATAMQRAYFDMRRQGVHIHDIILAITVDDDNNKNTSDILTLIYKDEAVKSPFDAEVRKYLRSKQRCRYCNKFGPMKKCGQCKRVYYCNEVCCRQDWLRAHKQECLHVASCATDKDIDDDLRDITNMSDQREDVTQKHSIVASQRAIIRDLFKKRESFLLLYDPAKNITACLTQDVR